MKKNSEDLSSIIFTRIEEIESQLEVVQKYQQDPKLFKNQKVSLLSELNLYQNYVKKLLKSKVQNLSDDEVDKYFEIVSSELASGISSVEDRINQEEAGIESQLSLTTQSIAQIDELLKWENWPIEGITSNRLIQTIIESSIDTYADRYFMNDYDDKGIITIRFNINPIYMNKLLNNDRQVLDFLNDLKKISGDNLSIGQIESELSKKFGYKTARDIDVGSQLCGRNTYARDDRNYQLFEENMTRARALNSKSFDGISYCERLKLKKRLSELKEKKDKLTKQLSGAKKFNSTYLSGLKGKQSVLSGLGIQAKKDYLLDRYDTQVSEEEYLDDIKLMSRIRQFGFANYPDDGLNGYWRERNLSSVKKFRDDLQRKKSNLDKLESFDVETFIDKSNNYGDSIRTALGMFAQHSSSEKTHQAQGEEISTQISGIERKQKSDIQPDIYQPKYSFPHIFFIEKFKERSSFKKIDKWSERKKEREVKIKQLQEKRSNILSMCDNDSRNKDRVSSWTKSRVFNYFETNYDVHFSDDEKKRFTFSLESEEELKKSISNFLKNGVKRKLSTPDLSLLSRDAVSLVGKENLYSSTYSFSGEVRQYISIDDAIKLADKLENQLSRIDLNLIKVSDDVLSFAEKVYGDSIAVPQDKIEQVLTHAAKTDVGEIISNSKTSGPRR